MEAGTRTGSRLDKEELAAIEYLRHWDNEWVDGSIGLAIFRAWYEHLRHDIFDPAIGDLGSKDYFDAFVDESAVYHVLAGTKSSVPISWPYLRGRTADQVRLQALKEAVDDLTKANGPDMTRWGKPTDWIPFEPLPSIPWYSRGTYIQAVELSNPRVHGVYILPPGESEDAKSPHFSDQLYPASWWMFTPMELLTEQEFANLARTPAK